MLSSCLSTPCSIYRLSFWSCCSCIDIFLQPMTALIVLSCGSSLLSITWSMTSGRDSLIHRLFPTHHSLRLLLLILRLIPWGASYLCLKGRVYTSNSCIISRCIQEHFCAYLASVTDLVSPIMMRLCRMYRCAMSTFLWFWLCSGLNVYNHLLIFASKVDNLTLSSDSTLADTWIPTFHLIVSTRCFESCNFSFELRYLLYLWCDFSVFLRHLLLLCFGNILRLCGKLPSQL